MVVALIEELLTQVQQLQLIMIAVSTGKFKIHEKEKEYTLLYKNIADLMESLEEEGVYIENPNNFKSLSSWRDRWSSLKSGYASKAGYIHDLYNSVFNQIDLISCQHYIKDKSQKELVDEWQISRFEYLIAKIKQLKLTMLSVATQGQPVELVKSEDEGYKKLYWEVRLQISILREIGIDAPESNQFQSLWQWYNYWSFELDNSKAVREEYIDNLYETLLKTIEKALKRHYLQKTSLEEFLQDLKRRFNQTTYTQATTDPIIITPILSKNVETYNLKSDERFQQPTSESVADSFSVPATQSFENSLFATANYSLSWTNENVMKPEIFLEQRDVTPLIMALNNFALKVNVASDRQNFLESAGVDYAFLSNLRFDTQSHVFAQSLVSAFKSYQISHKNFNDHPLVSVLESLRNLASIYGLKDQDVELYTRLVEKGQENFKALAACNTVGRIESPIGKAIGTGVLITKNFLLTCNHIFSKSQVQKAWVRFGYKDGSDESEKDIFKLDFISNNSQRDYALLKINPQTQQKSIFINETSILDSGQDVRIIHHPQGNPVIISDFGQITQVGEDYIDHNVKTDDGSSGAPIFNRQWELIAIHQGNPGIGRTVIPGSTGGIPIRAIWNQISPHLG
ncbi:MAG: trypsin-like peptidase domain-containing protein [Nostoc sp.]|uniref:trypsin-like peptidase domain-containing protein n=1 Tax=Nostoc sp. TaxID=1180 RepID=UPI002FFC4FA9